MHWLSLPGLRYRYHHQPPKIHQNKPPYPQGTEEMTTEELRGEVEGLRHLVAEASMESKAKLSQAERQEVEEQVNPQSPTLLTLNPKP